MQTFRASSRVGLTVAALAIICQLPATASAQTVDQVKKSLSMVGLSEPEVRKALGEPTAQRFIPGGLKNESWKGVIQQARFKPDGTMFFCWLPSEANDWKKALAAYGFNSKGVTVRKEDGDGGVTEYVLTGVRGLPKGWKGCSWVEGGLQLMPKPWAR